jgi:hypothetical protein
VDTPARPRQTSAASTRPTGIHPPVRVSHRRRPLPAPPSPPGTSPQQVSTAARHAARGVSTPWQDHEFSAAKTARRLARCARTRHVVTEYLQNSANERQRGSHAIGASRRSGARDPASAEAPARSRRSASRGGGRVSGSPRGEAPRKDSSRFKRRSPKQCERAAASEPRDRSEPAQRRARSRVGESEGRSPSERKD